MTPLIHSNPGLAELHADAIRHVAEAETNKAIADRARSTAEKWLTEMHRRIAKSDLRGAEEAEHIWQEIYEVIHG